MLLAELRRTTDAITFIEEHLTEKLELGRIARSVHSSRYHLHRTFSKTVGLTIHNYLRRRQLTEAAKRLAFSQMPIIDIADLAGYECQQSFTRIFSALYKISPNRFRRHGKYYPLQLPLDLGANVCTHQGLGAPGRWEIASATEDDLPLWMELVRLVVDGYPFLDEAEHVRAVRRAISRGQTLIVKDGQVAAGAMVLSTPSGNIDFFGVHPLYRHAGVTNLLIENAWRRLPAAKRELSITTFREGDRADTGYRRAILALGFVASDLLVEHSYPTQRFVLRRNV